MSSASDAASVPENLYAQDIKISPAVLIAVAFRAGD
jgi:hypothetical protein